MPSINILYQSSDTYVIPAAVSICSLLENNKMLDEIHLYFIEVGLTDEDKKGLTELVKRYHRTLTFISGEEADRLLAEKGIEKWSGSYATFYKLFTCCNFTDIDRILYIDADTVVQGSLEELCDYDMGNYPCAMAGSGMTAAVKNYLGIQDYFNAGVIYFNLDYWRKNGVQEKILKMVNAPDNKKSTMIGDETFINLVFHGQIKKLPLKYNFESSWWLWGWNKKMYQGAVWNSPDECYYNPEEIRRAKENPCILHYVDLTTGRPWDALNDNPAKESFAKYYKILNPWKAIDIPMHGIGGSSRIINIMKLIAKKLMPFSIRSKIGFSQHDNYWKNKIQENKEQGGSH